MRIQCALIVMGIAVTAGQTLAQERPYDPTATYKQESCQGFTVLINPQVLKHKQDAQEMRKELRSQLAKIARVVPANPLSALKRVRIWVEWEKQPRGAAAFHPSAVWLAQNGYNPEKAGDVELSNTRNFIQWSRTDQPWMVLHELSHAYHYTVLGEYHPGIQAAYQHAVERKLYAAVAYIHGGKQKAYALTNATEYFAELSEAFFGQNDFYPFTRAELKQYDPVGYQLMESTWGHPRGR